jgi:hypothetical protein
MTQHREVLAAHDGYTITRVLCLRKMPGRQPQWPRVDAERIITALKILVRLLGRDIFVSSEKFFPASEQPRD